MELIYNKSNLYKLFIETSDNIDEIRKTFKQKFNEFNFTENDVFTFLNNYKSIKPSTMAMIAVAAIRNPKLRADYTYKNFHYNLMLNKIESIFKIAIIHKHDSLVLGALGCGAFNNPPEEVAKIFKLMIDKYGKYFKKIGFAILVVKNKDSVNIDAFEKHLFN